MTDKQIIIDGIDVSGCPSYMDNGECINENVYPDYCKACSNCTYKLEQQLKRKEQECEELKDKLNCCFCNPYVELNNSEKQQKCVEVTECFRRQLDQLKADNEELKKIIERLDVPKHEVIDMDIALENDKLKQTLTEIKPILELYANSKIGKEQPNGTYEIMLNSGYFMAYDPKPARQGLQKISEVLDV